MSVIFVQTARELAKQLLEPYVKRGDSLESITDGHMGWGSRDIEAGIGMTIWKNGKRRKYSRFHLVVTRVNGQECLHVFSIPEIIEELKATTVQPSLWAALESEFVL
jgi:hypothetical protein